MTPKQQYQLNRDIEQFIKDNPATDGYTAEQKKYIAKFSGYGGLGKYGASGEGILYEYFTPNEVVQTMWRLCLKHGFAGGHILEPSAGVGRFFSLMPTDTPTPITGVGIEPNQISATIASVLNPSIEIQVGYFEQLFIANNNTIKDKIEPSFDLVIGNPPYGDISQGQGGLLMEMGERKHTQAQNYIDYFLRRGIDVLRPNGLLCYIVGSATGQPFLATGESTIKNYIAAKSTLLEAYRLPDGVFPYTDVVTEIIILKKN